MRDSRPMAIIERAVEIAQSLNKGDETSSKTAVVERSFAELDDQAHEPVTPARPALKSRTDPALTARDLKPIVQIDFVRLREMGRVPAPETVRRTENEMRRIKWPLLNAISGSTGHGPVRNNVILVTSALPGEGKTFTALNLALSIVRDRELRVILVDGDVQRPGLTPSLGL